MHFQTKRILLFINGWGAIDSTVTFQSFFLFMTVMDKIPNSQEF